MSQLSENAFNVFPNPSSGTFYLAPKEDAVVANLKVFDQLGNKISFDTDHDLNRYKLNLLGHPNGMYWLKMSTNCRKKR
jgi:hypothetical protein